MGADYVHGSVTMLAGIPLMSMVATDVGEKLLLSITELLNTNTLVTTIEKQAKEAVLNGYLQEKT